VATVGLLPLTVMLFGQASLAGPLANIVAIPWWSLVVVPLALAGTGLEALHAGLGEWPWRLAALAFDLPWPGFAWIARSPLALWSLPEPAWFAVPLALAGAAWLLLPRGVPGKPLALLLWLPLLWPQRGLPSRGDAVATVIDVGQGLSVLVRTQSHVLLYDTGPASPDGYDAGDDVVVPALQALGVRGLDAIVLSHGDNDHAGG
jgi:competence protein ComEC